MFASQQVLHAAPERSQCGTQKLRQHSEEQRAEEQQPKRRKGSKTDLFGNGPSPGRRCAPALHARVAQSHIYVTVLN